MNAYVCKTQCWKRGVKRRVSLTETLRGAQIMLKGPEGLIKGKERFGQGGIFWASVEGRFGEEGYSQAKGKPRRFKSACTGKEWGVAWHRLWVHEENTINERQDWKVEWNWNFGEIVLILKAVGTRSLWERVVVWPDFCFRRVTDSGNKSGWTGGWWLGSQKHSVERGEILFAQ